MQPSAINSLITVIISCYNTEIFVGRAIESVLAQTYPHKHLIIVDDGSTDHSSEIIQRYAHDYPGLITAVSQANQGVAKARDTGLAIAKGEWVSLLDADDMLLPHALETWYRYAEAHPQFSVIYSDVYRIDTDDNVINCVSMSDFRRHLEGNILASLIPGNIVATTALHRRADILSVGGFFFAHQNNTFGHEHYFLNLRLALAGYEFGYIASPLFYYRDTPASLSKNKNRLEAGRLAAITYAYTHHPKKMVLAVDQYIHDQLYPQLGELRGQLYQRDQEISKLREQIFHAPASELRINELEREKGWQKEQTDKWWADAMQFQQALIAAQQKIQALNATIDQQEQDRSWQQEQASVARAEVAQLATHFSRVEYALTAQLELSRVKLDAVLSSTLQSAERFSIIELRIDSLQQGLLRATTLIKEQGTLIEAQSALLKQAHHEPQKQGSLRNLYRKTIPVPIRLKLRDIRVGLIGR